MELIDNIPVWGPPEPGALAQIKTCAKTADKVALMGDHHLGYAVPIGGVVAYKDAISPSGVGFDIACGNKAVRLDIPAAQLRENIGKIMDDVWRTISFGIGRVNAEPVEHPLFEKDSHPGWDTEASRPLKRLAQDQLGTVGSGNHYVDLFTDEQDRVWIGVHFGSRGLGHKTATWFLRAAGAKDGMDVEPCVLPVASDLGAQYLLAMDLAGKYAYAGRDWVCQRVAALLGAEIVEEVHNHHNFCIPGDQKIPTPSGYKRMRDLITGDIVYSFDEANGLVESPILHHWHSGVKEIYRIRTRNREIHVSADHPLLTIQIERRPHPLRKWFDKHVGNYRWVKAGDLKEGDVLVCARGYYESCSAVGLDKARLTGAYLGDGWIRMTNPGISGYSVGLAIGSGRESHTKRYGDLCLRALPKADWKNNAPGAYGLTCSSAEVHSKIREMGLGLPSAERAVPRWVFALPLAEKFAFLSGYFDADGSVANRRTSNHGRGAVCSASRELVEGIREIAISCGLQVTPVRDVTAHSNFGNFPAYRCSLSCDGVSKLDLWHRAKALNQKSSAHSRPEGLQKSKIGYLDLPPELFGQRVLDIVPIGEQEVYDIEVRHETHSFVCEGVVAHNCWREKHGGEEFWVVRKGATPAFPGQRGFVGGTMGESAVILEGVQNEDAKYSLYSTVHGAGRVLGRMEAKGKVDRKTGEVKRAGKVTREMMQGWLQKAGVELRGAGLDESPDCYKRLPDVLAEHKDSIRILHTLTPVGVAMAGEGEIDPYKD